MDYTSLVYYAVICGLLCLAAPYLEKRLVRLGVGMAVGLIAATVLPIARDIAGP